MLPGMKPETMKRIRHEHEHTEGTLLHCKKIYGDISYKEMSKITGISVRQLQKAAIRIKKREEKAAEEELEKYHEEKIAE